MILYLYTSSLVKIYLEEAESDLARERVKLLPGDGVLFSAFDTRLSRAARAEGIPVLVPQEGVS